MEVRRLPADLAVMVGFTFLTLGVVLLPVVRDTPVRVVFGLPFVLFVPGYVLVAALYPAADPGSGTDDRWREPADRHVAPVERTALSFGSSLVVVSLVGLVLNYTPFGIRLVPVLLSLAALVLGLTAVAVRRRRSLPRGDRFAVPWRTWLDGVRSELFEPDSRGDAALNALLVCSILLAVVTVGYALTAPKHGEAVTEFYLLNGSDGQAPDDPAEFVASGSQSFTLAIRNQEHRPINYTVVAELRRTQIRDSSTQVVARERLRTFETRLGHNETWQRAHEVRPDMTGQRLQLAYLLYRDEPPSDPTTEEAYRTVHVWIDVPDSG
jgi:uncharacterized membrane protein